MVTPLLSETTFNSVLQSTINSLFSAGVDADAIHEAAKAINAKATKPKADRVLEISVNSKLTALEARAVTPRFEMNEAGNAARFISMFGHQLMFIVESSIWYLWTEGSGWAATDIGTVRRFSGKAADALLAEVNKATDALNGALEGESKALLKQLDRAVAWRNKTLSLASLNATIKLASDSLAVSASDLDCNPWVLGTKSGILDLKTGVERSEVPADLITKHVSVAYNPKAKATRWLRFIDEITCGDKDLARYLQKALGYSMTGSVSEEVMHISIGKGLNGKSILCAVAGKVLADYAQTTPVSVLFDQAGSGPSSAHVRMQGTRFVSAGEGPEGKRLSENIVKSMTSIDRQVARALYCGEIEWDPTHHIWLCTNYRPMIGGIDEGIWRRLRIIPFNADFSKCKEVGLLETLLGEAEGILAWLVEGCLLWQAEGLTPAKVMLAYAKEYRTDMDSLGSFLEQTCVEHSKASVQSSRLYKLYKIYQQEEGEFEISNKVFTQRLRQKGFKDVKSGVKMILALGLKADGLSYGDPVQQELV